MATIQKTINATGSGAINIALIEDSSSSVAWTVLVEGEIGGQWIAVGNEFTTVPPAGARDGARLIAQAQYLGASSYRVTATTSGTPTGTPALVLSGMNVELSAPVLFWDDVTPPDAGGGGGGGGGGVVPVTPGILWVDQATTVPTSLQTGSIAQPFATIGQAIAAASAYTAIMVLPGTYAEIVTMRDLDGISIIGSGEGDTIIAPASGGTPIFWEPALASGQLVKTFLLSSLSLVASGGASSILVDASAVNAAAGATAAFCADGFTLDRVSCESTSGVTLSLIGEVNIRECAVFGGGTLSLSQCLSGHIYDTTTPNLELVYSDGSIAPAGARGQIWLAPGTKGSALTISAQSNVLIDDGTQWQSVSISGTSSSTYGLVVEWRGGRVLGSTSIAMPEPTTVAASVTLVNVQLGNQSVFGVSKISGASRVPVKCRGCAFLVTTGNLTAGDLVDLDIRQCSFAEGALAVTGSGTIDRDRTIITGRTPSLIGDAATFDVPFPASVTSAELVAVGTTSGAPVGATFGFTAVTSSGLTATASSVESGAVASYVVERLS